MNLDFFKKEISRMHGIVSNNNFTKKTKEKFNHYFPEIEKYFFHILYSFTGLVLLFAGSYAIFWRAPSDFPQYSIITIQSGESLGNISSDLQSQNIILSSFWLKVFVFMEGGEKKVIAGDYYFPKPVSIFKVAGMIIKGDFGLTTIKVPIPEGLNSKEISKVLALNLPRFDQVGFTKLAKNYEGYLFPDTYFLTVNAHPADIIAMMREEFARKIDPYQVDIVKFGHPLSDDIIVASIIEDEASTIDDKRIIAGIIWRRLNQKMPLQVDSTLHYSTGKTSSQLTKEELQNKNDPYNTYANPGLPPTPISNPGIDSIRAAITPTNTRYLYFLSDKHGVMHYAETFAQHKANRDLYLN